MKELFVPYPLAKIVKEKGFDETTMAYYDIDKPDQLIPIPMKSEINSFHCNRNSLMIGAPLYQQLLNWFREKHEMNIYFVKISTGKWYWKIQLLKNLGKGDKDHPLAYSNFVDSYEEAMTKSLEQAFDLI